MFLRFIITLIILLLPNVQSQKAIKPGYIKPLYDDTKVAPTKDSSTVLQGSLTQLRSIASSKKIESVPEKLRVGAIFDQRNLPACDKFFQWYRIPNWIAGTWYRKYEKILSQNNVMMPPKQIESEITNQIGLQKDRLGNVWSLTQTPSISTINGGNYSVANVIKGFKVLAYKKNQFIIRSTSFQIYVNNLNSKIFKVQQNEIVTVYSPLNYKEIQSLSRVDWYNAEGLFLFSDERVSTQYKIKEFELVQKLDNGQDAKQNFTYYLSKVGLAYLIPN